VLDSLAPAERLAFVLHDIFDVPFDQIAPIVNRSEPAARQLASRARRRIRTTASSEADLPARADANLSEQWEVVDAFLTAAREGDFEALLSVLDPDVVRRVDTGPTGPDLPRVLRGAQAVATSAMAFNLRRHTGRRVVVNGAPGFISFLDGRPFAVLGFTIAHGKIVEMNILADPLRLQQLDLTV
jgi:RNA polymerase sigma-70 factor (ECF subfamily)